jgi:hypothetical protein
MAELKSGLRPHLELLRPRRVALIGNHPAIENGFPVRPAIVDAIQTDDRSLKVKANGKGDARHQQQNFSQERRFIAIAGRRSGFKQG